MCAMITLVSCTCERVKVTDVTEEQEVHFHATSHRYYTSTYYCHIFSNGKKCNYDEQRFEIGDSILIIGPFKLKINCK